MTEASPNPCRFCRKPLFEFPMGEKNGYRFTACKTCGSVWAEPWPTVEVLDKFFGDIQPEIVHMRNPQGQIINAKQIIAKAWRDYPGKRFLDVSCRQGYGAFGAKELGFAQVRGIDSHAFYIAFAKDKYDPHLFEHVTVENYAERGEQADFILSLESFCEQTDPEKYAAALKKILAPGGKIYIQEPDGNHARLPTNFASWPFVDPPLNFSYPSKKGLEYVLWRNGLKIERKFFSWAPFMKLVVGHR